MKKFFIFILNILLLSILGSTLCYANDTPKTIYLTFDDGPSNKVAEDTLDILKKENVKATFFIVGNEIKNRENILKRMYDEGHSIGLHSLTHEKCNLYSSNEKFLKEMLDTQKLIENVIGIKPTILRFPFGSNNSTYKLKKSLVDLLHSNNLKIYDWTVDSGDGASPNASKETYIKNSKSDSSNITLLMHCGTINKNSPKALPEIIKYYKSKGYEFKTINEDTPELFHILK